VRNRRADLVTNIMALAAGHGSVDLGGNGTGTGTGTAVPSAAVSRRTTRCSQELPE
jgi:hypothetical protein